MTELDMGRNILFHTNSKLTSETLARRLGWLLVVSLTPTSTDLPSKSK